MKQPFTQSQAFRIWPTFIFSSSILFLLQPMLLNADYEGWIAYLVSYPITLFFLFFSIRIAQINPTGEWIQFGSKIVGRWLHSLTLILFIYYCLFIAIHDMLGFTKSIHTSYLYETPSIMITLIFIICPTFLAILGLQSIIYFIDSAFSIIIPIFFAAIPLIIKELDFAMLPAIVTHFDIQKVSYSAYYANHWFGDIAILFLVLTPHFQSVKKPMRTLAKAHLIVLILHLSYWMGTLLLFGPYLGGHLLYPALELVNHVSLRTFLENFEPVFMVLAMASFVSKVALLLHILSTILQHLLQLSNQVTRFFPTGFAFLITIATEFLIKVPAQVLQYTDFFYGSLFVIKFIPLIYFLIYQLRFRWKEQSLSN